MRRVHPLLHALALGLALLAGPRWLMAQPSMDFRPVPPESVDQYMREARERARDAARDARETTRQSLDSLGTSEEPAAPATAADDATPAPPVPVTPAVPVPPTITSTGEILRFGSDIHVPAGQVVEGDVVSMGGDVEVEGHVKGNVTSMGGDVTLRSGSRVDGRIATFGGELREEPGSSVGGERVTTPGAPGGKLLLPALAVVGTGVQVALSLMKLLVLLGLTWLVVKLASGRTQRSVETIRQEPGTAFLLGLAVLALLIPSVFVLALVIALLCITIIGIPLAAAVAVAYAGLLVVLFVWGWIVGATLFGSRIRERLRPGAPSLMADALWGVGVVQGLRVASQLFHGMPLFGFIGGLVNVIAIVLGAVLCVFGAGALIRQEYVRRTVQDWWHRARPTPVGRVVEDWTRRGQPDAPPPPPPAPAAPAAETLSASTPPTPPSPAGGTAPEAPPPTPGS